MLTKFLHQILINLLTREFVLMQMKKKIKCPSKVHKLRKKKGVQSQQSNPPPINKRGSKQKKVIKGVIKPCRKTKHRALLNSKDGTLLKVKKLQLLKTDSLFSHIIMAQSMLHLNIQNPQSNSIKYLIRDQQQNQLYLSSPKQMF